MFRPTPQLMTDSYKVSHWRQYPPDTEAIYSYLSARGGVFPAVAVVGIYPKMRWLQDFFRELGSPDSVRNFWTSHFGSPKIYNESGWDQLTKLGHFPVKIKSVPEGTVVPNGNVLLTIENTDPRFYWLPNWLETQLMQLWYPITACTQSREIKKLLAHYLDLTADSRDGLEFKLHDFGFRGVSSNESAAIGAASHLFNFLGTDTPIGIEYLEYYYKGKVTDKENLGYSIPAAEHSTISSWDRDHELEAAANMIQQFQDGLVAIVGDTYDIYNFCANIIGDQLKAKIEARDGVVIVRPDSGNPVEVVTRCLDILGERFGFKLNSKGFKELNPKVRLIQGDGVDYESIRQIMFAMYEAKWSVVNIAFGMGGALLQKLNRDTQKMAIKCSAIKRGGKWYDVYKDPITDPGKKSHAGRLALVTDSDGIMSTVRGPHDDDLLQTVFEDGRLFTQPSIYEIRERLKI